MFAKKIEVDLKRPGLDEWEGFGRTALASGSLRDGRYQLGPHEGGLTKASLKTKSGERFRTRYRIRTLQDANNGGDAHYHVGPVFFDKAGKVIGWYDRCPARSSKDGAREDEVVSVAPEGAAYVRLGVFGSWAPAGKPAANCVSAFEGLSLRSI